jgi:hypothetical protein
MLSARIVVAALLFSLSGCAGGPDAEALQKDVEAAAQAKDYAGAVTKADEALKVEVISKDAAKAWRFEALRLDALADGGKGADVVASIERLKGSYEKQLTAAVYRKLAGKLEAAGDRSGANDVLVAGDKRFTDDPSFKAEIERINSAGATDPAEVERLKALGYLGNE